MTIGKCPLTKVEMGLVIPEDWHSTWALPCIEHQIYPVVLIYPEWLQYSFFQIVEVGSHGLWRFTQALALLRFFSFIPFFRNLFPRLTAIFFIFESISFGSLSLKILTSEADVWARAWAAQSMGFTVKTLHSCEAVNDRRVSGGEGTGRPTPVHQAKCPRCVYVISVCVHGLYVYVCVCFCVW